MSLGAFLNPRFARSDVRSGQTHVALCEGPPMPIHPGFWRQLGVEPRQADFCVQKNFFHYRMFYLTTSFHHIPVVSAGLTARSIAWWAPSRSVGSRASNAGTQ